MVTRARRNRHDPSTVQAAVAAGHPATVEAGVEILSDGGSAADAAVAAALASCVAETVMTGLLGGGHAIYFDASSGRARNLDCFVAVPGLGVEPRRDVDLVKLQVPFRAFLRGSAPCTASTAGCRGRGWSSRRSGSRATGSSFRRRTPLAWPCSRR